MIWRKPNWVITLQLQFKAFHHSLLNISLIILHISFGKVERKVLCKANQMKGRQAGEKSIFIFLKINKGNLILWMEELFWYLLTMVDFFVYMLG